MADNKLLHKVETLRDKLSRELARLAALRHKSRTLEIEYRQARQREERASRVVDELLQRQREITSVLERADAALRRNQDILTRVSPQLGEMARSLPESERGAWIERLMQVSRLSDSLDLHLADQRDAEPASAEIADAGEPDVEPLAVDVILEEPVEPYALELLLAGGEPAAAGLDDGFDLAVTPPERRNLEFELDSVVSIEAGPDIFSAFEQELERDDDSELLIVRDDDPLAKLDSGFDLETLRCGSPFVHLCLDLPLDTPPDQDSPDQLDIFVGPGLLPPLDNSFELASGSPTGLDDTFRLSLVSAIAVPARDEPRLAFDLDGFLSVDDQIAMLVGRSLLPFLDSGFRLAPDRRCGLEDTFRLELALARNGTACESLGLAFGLDAPLAADDQIAVFVDPSLLPFLDSAYRLVFVPNSSELAGLDESFVLLVPEWGSGILPLEFDRNQPQIASADQMILDWGPPERKETHAATEPAGSTEPVISEFRVCPRCGRANRRQSAACLFCYAPMGEEPVGAAREPRLRFLRARKPQQPTDRPL